MDLRFEIGDSGAPRGHAIIYARSGGPDGPLLATYCVVLPIAFSIGKYLPPMFAAQMPMEGMGDVAAMSVVPIPPMLEEAESLAELSQAAERRGDDLCDMGVLFITSDTQRMTFAAEAAQAYGTLYGAYAQTWPVTTDELPGMGAPAELEVEDVLAEVLSDRDRLAELSRSVGMLRYALEGHDQRLVEKTAGSMRRMAATLPEKYRAAQLIDAAVLPGEPGAQLARLYLQRAYKLADEDYAAIPPIEREIRALRGEGSGESSDPGDGSGGARPGDGDAGTAPGSPRSSAVPGASGGPGDTEDRGDTGDTGDTGAPDAPARPERPDPGGP